MSREKVIRLRDLIALSEGCSISQTYSIFVRDDFTEVHVYTGDKNEFHQSY